MQPKKNKWRYAIWIISISIIMAVSLVIYREKRIINELENSIRNNKVSINIYDKLVTYPPNAFEHKFSSGELLFVYMGRSECSDCSSFFPLIESKIKEYKLNNKLMYIECEKIHQNNDEWLSFKKTYGFTQTPALIIYDKSTIVNMIEWDEKEGLSEKKLDSWLTENSSLINSISL